MLLCNRLLNNPEQATARLLSAKTSGMVLI